MKKTLLLFTTALIGTSAVSANTNTNRIEPFCIINGKVVGPFSAPRENDLIGEIRSLQVNSRLHVIYRKDFGFGPGIFNHSLSLILNNQEVLSSDQDSVEEGPVRLNFSAIVDNIRISCSAKQK